MNLLHLWISAANFDSLPLKYALYQEFFIRSRGGPTIGRPFCKPAFFKIIFIYVLFPASMNVSSMIRYHPDFSTSLRVHYVWL